MSESDRGCTCPINRTLQAEYVPCPVHDKPEDCELFSCPNRPTTPDVKED